MNRFKMIRNGLSLVVLGLLIQQNLSFAESTGSPSFQAVALEANGTKFWQPSTFVVKKGDTVKIHAVSKIEGKNNVHGFAIDAFKVEALVDGKGKDIEFVADKKGIFPIRCHLHPAHIGGQLVVLE